MMNKYQYRSLAAGQIYRVEVCDGEEVTEMQSRSKTHKHAWRTASLIIIKFTLTLSLFDWSKYNRHTGIFNVSMNALIVPNR